MTTPGVSAGPTVELSLKQRRRDSNVSGDADDRANADGPHRLAEDGEVVVRHAKHRDAEEAMPLRTVADLIPEMPVTERKRSAFEQREGDHRAAIRAAAGQEEGVASRDYAEQRERTLADLDARRAGLLAALETTDDPDGVLAQDVNYRVRQLVDQQHAATPELHHHKANPPDANGQAPELLDRIGHVGRSRLKTASEPDLRTLFRRVRHERHLRPHRQAEDGRTDDHRRRPERRPGTASPELGICVARSAGRSPDPQPVTQRCSLRISATFAVPTGRQATSRKRRNA